MTEPKQDLTSAAMQEDFEDFFDNALCGYLTLDSVGKIIKCNKRIGLWMNCDSGDLIGKSFTELLTIGSKIYFETHLRPLLQMQEHFDQVSLELKQPGRPPRHVFVNAIARKPEDGSAPFTRVTIFNATERGTYEQTLRSAKSDSDKKLLSERETSILREQFIAILGHDLRNPLGAIWSGVELLSGTVASERERAVVAMMRSSSTRMLELIDNVMDLARSRLGDGIQVNKTSTSLEPVFTHVIEELSSTFPDRNIITEFSLTESVNCDAARISQILSNLLANAITHGARTSPIYVRAEAVGDGLTLSVSNSGTTIDAGALEKIFEPFKRESEYSSKEGLGLGLYIASQIALAHDGVLTATSVNGETCFKLRMP